MIVDPPVTVYEVIQSRRWMRQGMSMQYCANRLAITPSGKLDLALWRWLGESDEALRAKR